MYSIRSCMCFPESNIHYWQAPRASCPGPWCPPTSQPSSAAPSRGIGIGWALGEAFALFLSFSSFIKELPQIFTHAGSSCLTFRSFARRPYLMKCFLKQSSHLQRNQLLEEKSMTMLTTTQKCIWKSLFFWDFAHLFLRARLSRSCRSSFCSISTYQVLTTLTYSNRPASILITDVSGLVWFGLAMVNCHRYFEHSRLHKLLHSCRVLCSLVWLRLSMGRAGLQALDLYRSLRILPYNLD